MIALLSLAFAQSPSFVWKVVETEHYRVHYPEPAEAWALETAGRLESVRERVAEEVGWAPPFKVQVVIQDPYSDANGMVLPLGRSPRMVLWTTPPGADSVIGHFRDPFEDLAVHEDAHVVHLLKPPRGLSGRLVYEVFGLAPITLKSPRWVLEGYATVVEGRLSGSGRPHADQRAVLLRRLAQEGQLPHYGELSASERWQGMGYAYLVGSAYLEWLEARQGEGSLRALWARMTAKTPRSFDEAFEGVFGESAPVLYRRFTAELTADAMAHDGAEPDRSTLWLDLKGTTGRPALSPDGGLLAATQHPGFGMPPSLKVWKTEVDQKAVDRAEERAQQVLERDPEDVRAVPPAHPPHQIELAAVHRTRPASGPRFVNADTLLVDAPVIDLEGRVRRDLFTVAVDGGALERVTRFADVRDADPLPDGSAAIAVRGAWGANQLVRVDLASGEVTPLTEPSVTAIVDQPRVSKDGQRLVFLRHVGGRYRPFVRDLAGGPETALDLPDGAIAIHVAWAHDGSVIAALGVEGRIDLWRLGGDAPERLTASGAAFAPEPAADGGIHFLAWQPDGFEIHRLPPDAPVVPAPDGPLGLDGRAPPLDYPPLERVELEPRAFGLGRLEPRLVVGGMVGSGGANFEGGVRLGDIVGRNELVALGSLGDSAGVTGGGFWYVNRTLPLDAELRGWALRPGFEGPAWLGASGALSFDARGAVGRAVGEGGAWAEVTADGGQRGAAFGGLRFGVVEPRTRAFGAWTGARGASGWDDEGSASLGEMSGGFAIGRTWTLASDYAIGFANRPFSLGGVTSGVRADAAQWDTLRAGWLPAETAAGTVHDVMRGSLGIGGLDLLVERRRVWDPIGSVPHSLVGFRFRQGVGPQPEVRSPGVEIEIGVGCHLEAVVIREDFCRKIEHYRSWSQLTWRP